MKTTMKALSVAVSLLMAADGYVITQAMAAPVPVKPMAASDGLVTQAQSGSEWLRRRGGGHMRGFHRGGDFHGFRGGDFHRFRGGDFHRFRGGDFYRHRGAQLHRGREFRRDYFRPGRNYVHRDRDFRRYGSLAQYGGDRHWRYDRHRHGDRYHHRHGWYRHYHNGFWYTAPFWLSIGPYGYGYDDYDYGYYGGYYGDDWIAWCSRRYRSFNPATGMYFTGTRWKLCRPYGYGYSYRY